MLVNCKYIISSLAVFQHWVLFTFWTLWYCSPGQIDLGHYWDFKAIQKYIFFQNSKQILSLSQSQTIMLKYYLANDLC